jgi:hypothetical protein
MRIVSIRMADESWEAIQAEALNMGISASEFMREAALVRLGYRWARREPEDEMIERLRRLGIFPADY